MRNDGKLDPTNRRMLALLQEDGRISASALGRKLGLSRTAVQDRDKETYVFSFQSQAVIFLKVKQAKDQELMLLHDPMEPGLPEPQSGQIYLPS